MNPIAPATNVEASPSTRWVTIQAPTTRLAPNDAEWIIASRHRGPERRTAPRCWTTPPASPAGRSASRGPSRAAAAASAAATTNDQRQEAPTSSSPAPTTSASPRPRVAAPPKMPARKAPPRRRDPSRPPTKTGPVPSPTTRRATASTQNAGLSALSTLASATRTNARRTRRSGPSRCAGTAAGSWESAWVTSITVVRTPIAPSETAKESARVRAIGPSRAKFQPMPSAIRTTWAISAGEGRVGGASVTGLRGRRRLTPAGQALYNACT